MMMRILALIGFGTALLLRGADDPKQRVQVSNTEHVDFPPNGTLRFANSIGVLTVEAWDQPGVEITTIKSTKLEYEEADREKETHELGQVRVATERHGDELVITTTFPRNRVLHPVAGESNFDLEYRIKAPSTARIIAQHNVGGLNVDGLVGDIQATLREGQITLHLPQDGQYDITAKSRFGHVNNDFPGLQKRQWWFLGHRVVNGASAATHKLNLKVGYGDIVILKTQIPKL
ncbi:MAG: hypothetical protein ABSB35_30550 [Bryobacteraceae bacterium]|jgi:hypothetical protein